MITRFCLFCLLIVCSAIAFCQEKEMPQVQREFRAAWVATVANINWPSKPGLPVEQQKQEAIRLLDFLKAHNFNAVVFQVRPQADALYKSDLEPWSYYLTGTQGKAPEPFYDPLEFWIEEAHDRGLELHAWLNPYRAHHTSGGPLTDSSVVRKKPGLALKLKEGYWWFDPSKQEVQEHAAAVVMDIVQRYDVDGIHFDDYFYPYPAYNRNEDFPDGESWKTYKKDGGKLSRADWRRDGVNQFIEKLYKNIKKESKHVKFGISPFGVWRPGYPQSVSGLDQYNVLYADAKLWLNKGWIDYFAPQLYWPINRQGQSFPVLLGWWAGENKKERHLWPGINVGDDSPKNVNEILNQVMISRGMLPQSTGLIHWSIGQAVRNTNMAKALLEGPYKNNALVPASPWLNDEKPDKPEVKTEASDTATRVYWTHKDAENVFRWVVYYQLGDNWNHVILNRADRYFDIKKDSANQPLKKVAVSAVDYTGNEGKAEVKDMIKPSN